MFTKKFWLAVATRAAYTFAESALAMLPVAARIEQVDWVHIVSVAALSAVISALKSFIVGLPETAKRGE